MLTLEHKNLRRNKKFAEFQSINDYNRVNIYPSINSLRLLEEIEFNFPSLEYKLP